MNSIIPGDNSVKLRVTIISQSCTKATQSYTEKAKSANKCNIS